MTASTLPTSQLRDRRQRAKLRGILVIAAAIALAVLAALLWYASEIDEHSAISELSQRERDGLYQRTLHTLQTTCDPARQPSGLEPFCHDQAEFIVQFPECDASCRALANVHRGPTR